ncbi:DNA primase [Campylobacter curvus]|uniref:DNA primase n=1 Tax=Campylobacter curvus TaxID=200 RepID=UPI0003755B46|nr:DNA primase [Campylobacter curvus]QKF62171.1 DNA primase [Campylobacter curvus]UEB50463.1 DNA primase [Campylobacter curvus]
MIEPKSIQKLKDQIDIVDIISHYISVRKMGANFKCICPFHDDRNPSMSISQSKQIFHCFACKAGGDAIKFVMDYEKLNYVEAIEKIAQISNFSLEYTSERNFAPKENKHILENVNAFYRSAFYKNDEAVRYIYSRGINDAMIERFELGWAGDSAQTIRLLENEKIEPSEALEVGIVKQNERGIYASFISRITFPIYNHTGRLVGFGGRTISNNPAKYVNSPQSAVFDKSKLLYGYHLAKQKIFEKKQIIITEGYLDVIMLHFAGFTNAVAVLGTALTEKHLPLLKRDDINVVLCFDGDAAGINAAIKSSHLLSLNEIDGSVVIIAGGADPADMVFAGRIKELEELFASGVELGEFYIRQIAKNYDLTRPVQKQKCLEEIEAYTKNLKNIVASSYAPLVASLLGIDMSSFSLGGVRAQNTQPNSQNFINRPIARAQKDILEISILKSMLFNENFAAIVLDTIDEKYFLHHKEGFRAILSNSGESDEILLREIELDESAMVIGDEKKLLSAIANLKIKFYENLQLHIRSSSDSDKIEKLQKIAAIINNLKFQIRNS